MYETLKSLNTKNAQKRLDQLNKGKKPSPVMPGSVVFIRFPPSAVAPAGTKHLKFLDVFRGPYICVSRAANNTVTLRDLATNTYLPHPTHLSRLKTFAHFNPALYFANDKCLTLPQDNKEENE
jgi:hypothetical protein